MITRNYLEDEFKSSTLFLNEAVFEPEYIPNIIKHRDNELIFLSRLFLPLLTHPFSMSKKILITGSVGVGKTVTLQLFGRMIKESARKRDLNIKFIHINCRHKRTSASILKTILDELIGGIPSRGLSYRDFLEILVEYLREHKCYLILVLDELGFIMKKDSDLIYTLTRVNEMQFSSESYLSFVGIVKDIVSLKNLDDATVSSLQNEVIRFRKYTECQIQEILRDRTGLGLKPGIIDDSILQVVSSLTSVSGDMRIALKILKSAVQFAELKQMEKITLEVIQEVNSTLFPLSQKELLQLNLHELLLYSSICNILTSSHSEITMNELKEEYCAVCENYKETPRSDTQLWEYVQTLKRSDLLSTKLKNKHQQGRQSYISIPNYSVKTVQKEIEKILKGGTS
jgi:cell division control protein 6